MTAATLLDGLPAYGPLAIGFPDEWGKLGREGIVVRFASGSGEWSGNFRPGLNGLTSVGPHPNGRDVLVIAQGDLWVVDPGQRSAELVLPAIASALPASDPDGWIFNCQGLALARLTAKGVLWHTRRLSWDGFDRLRVAGDDVTGEAWSPLDDQWHPFRVDIRTGRSTGGSFSDSDSEHWERLAHVLR